MIWWLGYSQYGSPRKRARVIALCQADVFKDGPTRKNPLLQSYVQETNGLWRIGPGQVSSQRWSNFRYFRLLPWVRTTGELRLCPHRRRGEGVGVRIGG